MCHLLETGADSSLRAVSINISPLDIAVKNKGAATSPAVSSQLARALTNVGAGIHEVGSDGVMALHRDVTRVFAAR